MSRATRAVLLALAVSITPATGSPAAAYRHPLGVSFDPPAAWSVRESIYGLEVVPPDAGRNASGPTELYLVTMLGAPPDVRSLDDPRAAQALGAYVGQWLPFLVPQGGARPVTAGTDARAFTWAGRSPQGMDVSCRVYGRLEGGYFLSVTALGDAARVRDREDRVVALFASLTLGPPDVSSELAGTWHTGASHATGAVGDRITVTTAQTVTLLPSGALASSTQSAYSGATGGGGGPGSSVTGHTDAAHEEGRWAVQDGTVYLLWKSGGAARYTFYVQGAPGARELLLTPPQGEKFLWTETAY